MMEREKMQVTKKARTTPAVLEYEPTTNILRWTHKDEYHQDASNAPSNCSHVLGIFYLIKTSTMVNLEYTPEAHLFPSTRS